MTAYRYDVVEDLSRLRAVFESRIMSLTNYTNWMQPKPTPKLQAVLDKLPVALAEDVWAGLARGSYLEFELKALLKMTKHKDVVRLVHAATYALDEYKALVGGRGSQPNLTLTKPRLKPHHQPPRAPHGPDQGNQPVKCSHTSPRPSASQ